VFSRVTDDSTPITESNVDLVDFMDGVNIPYTALNSTT